MLYIAHLADNDTNNAALTPRNTDCHALHSTHTPHHTLTHQAPLSWPPSWASPAHPPAGLSSVSCPRVPRLCSMLQQCCCWFCCCRFCCWWSWWSQGLRSHHGAHHPHWGPCWEGPAPAGCNEEAGRIGSVAGWWRGRVGGGEADYRPRWSGQF